MTREALLSRLQRQGILISDGAWGTFLQKKGLQVGSCPELWCLKRRSDVLDIAQSYVDAGAQLIETNSFGGSSLKLAHFDLAEQAREINQAAAEISRQAAGDDVYVLGSVGPTGVLLMMGDVSEEQVYESFKEQVMALAAGGADAICIETMLDVEEAVLAIKATRENTDLPAICTFTFSQTAQGEYRTMMGVSPTEAALAAHAAGAAVVGTNCGNGMERMVAIVAEMRAALPEVPILVHANAGMPKLQQGMDVFPDTPEDMARLAPQLAAAGATVIGGCCGTTPEHVTAIRQALTKN